jgi:aromatic ring-opening dioxygenase catalytic subunit (LigB family)
MYKLGFKSRGDSALSQRVVEALKGAGIAARTTPASEPRGRDGRGFNGPGFDHGVFIPFRIMFGDAFAAVPIVEVSMDSSLAPADEWALGAAVADLRKEGVLVLAGGLTIHNLRAFESFAEHKAGASYKAFDAACLDAVVVPEVSAPSLHLRTRTDDVGSLRSARRRCSR